MLLGYLSALVSLTKKKRIFAYEIMYPQSALAASRRNVSTVLYVHRPELGPGRDKLDALHG
jgi:hypothetical protein